VNTESVIEESVELQVQHNVSFTLPLVSKQKKEFLEGAFSPSKKTPEIRLLHGTTTLSFIYQGGIVVAVDSRATQGPYIASQSVQKVIEINPYMLGTMAGGAADCQFWERELGRRTRLFQLKIKKECQALRHLKLLQI